MSQYLGAMKQGIYTTTCHFKITTTECKQKQLPHVDWIRQNLPPSPTSPYFVDTTLAATVKKSVKNSLLDKS